MAQKDVGNGPFKKRWSHHILFLFDIFLNMRIRATSFYVGNVSAVDTRQIICKKELVGIEPAIPRDHTAHTVLTKPWNSYLEVSMVGSEPGSDG